MGRMKQLGIELEELGDALMIEAGLDPDLLENEPIRKAFEKRLNEFVDREFLQAFPTEKDGGPPCNHEYAYSDEIGFVWCQECGKNLSPKD